MNKKGFTLIEILAVIVILNLVITITATKGFGAFDNTKSAITQQNLNAIKEAANVLATQIDNCDDDVDSELWDGDDNLADINNIPNDKKDCSGLKEKMSSNECINVTVDYLINNDYLSDNNDFKDLKKLKFNICKDEQNKITIKDNKTNNDPDESNKQNNDPDESKEKDTLRNTILTSAKKGGENRTTMGTTKTEFTSISGANDRLLNNAPDDYGTSYYYYGAVTDNYVSFADKLWRIVRINGDGSIRLVLDDVAKDTSGNVITTKFNTSYGDNAYVGYMYGIPGSTTYDDTHKNINDSTIKIAVDKWYEDNLKTNYANYLADALFCNDKTLANSSIGYNNTALGYGTNITYYASVERLQYSTGRTNITISKPTFKCAENANNDYSRFTVNASTLPNGNKTNGNLTYPVGLLTADEVVYAGAYKSGQTNQTYYLYNSSISSGWRLSSPFYYYGGSYANEWYVGGSDGYLNYGFVNYSFAFRPSINLKAETLKNAGDGTKSNPYTVLIN